MANAKCRTCDHAAAVGAHCSSCAAGIMAKALDPFFRGRRKKLPRPEPPKASRPSAQQGLVPITSFTISGTPTADLCLKTQPFSFAFSPNPPMGGVKAGQIGIREPTREKAWAPMGPM